MIPRLFLMVGLPASGKSTEARILSGQYNAELFSSDDLREELFGDVNCQTNNELLFKELHKRIKECLLSGHNAIYDATNISYKCRVAFLMELKNIPCRKAAVVMATPYEECLKRNVLRERQVPEEVMKRMYMNFYVPGMYEGFDIIQLVYADGAYGKYGYPTDWLYKMSFYNQENSHHNLTLGEHCGETLGYILEHYGVEHNANLRVAATLHDNGKPFTKTYVNGKGEVTDEAHYFGHENVGAYNSLFFDGEYDRIYVANLIQFHMRPYTAWAQSEKAMAKDCKRFGEKMFTDICKLHEADVYAH